MGDATHFTVVLGITGSIAAYKSAELVRQLRALRDPQFPERRVEVRAILTEHGAQFITPVTLRTLTGNHVNQDLFASAEAWDVQHISLADDADVLLIAPATANIIAKLAVGLADDLLSSVSMAVTSPILVAPAMNVHMWQHPANQANVRVLRERGVQFIGPGTGELACGYEGRGRLADLGEIVVAAETLFLQKPHVIPEKAISCDLADKKVVITAGPTREFLDPVRFLSNPSTGKMGYALARAAHMRGAEVTLVSGPVDLAPPAGIQVISVVSTADMAEATAQAAATADVVIGAAAPADFTPAHPASQKTKKHGRTQVPLELVPTTDILAEIGQHKRPGQVIVAFAAETENLEEYARAKLARKNADVIVANDVTAPDAGFAVETNRAVLLFADGRRLELPLQQKEQMAQRILDAVVELLK
ncbi:MAG: bifunctional phosphopantothenoylcysteine decarboxylase/phosphopantothenate--cysteine ligase CoaBC [Armatimonadota bacterium]